MPEETAVETKPQESVKLVGRFRLLRGTHFENKTKINRGDVFESKSNLLRFNSAGSIRFERVGSGSKLTKDVYGTKGKATQGTVSPSYEHDQQKLLQQDKLLSEKDKEIERLKLELANRNASYTVDDLVNQEEEDLLGDDDPTAIFDSMSLQELKAHAEAEEIDLGGATKKQDIIDVLRAAEKVS